jgi:hypothetical protein
MILQQNKLECLPWKAIQARYYYTRLLSYLGTNTIAYFAHSQFHFFHYK